MSAHLDCYLGAFCEKITILIKSYEGHCRTAKLARQGEVELQPVEVRHKINSWQKDKGLMVLDISNGPRTELLVYCVLLTIFVKCSQSMRNTKVVVYKAMSNNLPISYHSVSSDLRSISNKSRGNR